MMIMMIGGRGAAEEVQGLFRDEGGWANDQLSHSVGISWAQQWCCVGCVHSHCTLNRHRVRRIELGRRCDSLDSGNADV